MDTGFNGRLAEFVKTYEGGKLAIVVTGGGVSLGQIALVPGASKVLHSFYVPYETKESVEFIRRHYFSSAADEFAGKAVSSNSAYGLYAALYTKNKAELHSGIHNIAITAALS